MECIIQPSFIHHRSKARIKDLGEVFTPDDNVNAMLKLLEQDNNFSWSDEDIAFFEPCCGHGNIVVAIFFKRLEAFFCRAVTYQSPEYAAYYAIANAINTLWAIDIDRDNIADCRTRLLKTSLQFLVEKLNIKDYAPLINKDREYIAHLLCTIKWQIHENEMLSAMINNKKSSRVNAQKTKISNQWIVENGHNPINFKRTWAEYFRKYQYKNSTPILFKQALNFINAEYSSKNDIFDFARNELIIKINQGKEINSGELWSRI
ncbi:hypothetical protein [Legionella jordanis]|uniref:Uncharacterized protein n=1 Tax=Legionella jordanis TaxID=456 RepID=A0A0W0VB80_9GAMM|nr:hypothetical protein [Legionella jordanis]KTD16905.1 hypothetical protein Ljor_1211 [Legionella jordanis]RMX00315.1 hypothetical protein EAW55_12860 [Legionella jordanis]VEH13602.1 Uncharacterised protein [Legionella jordanis]